MDKKTVREHVQRAKNGDVDAFAAVFESYRDIVRAIAWRLVGPNDADDVVMETYLKAWRAIPRFNERSSLKTWLYRITHNCAMDFLRARNRRQERVLAEDEHDSRTVQDIADDRQELPLDKITRSENGERVREALSQLEDPYRTILLFRFAEDMSYADIAAAMDISIGTVMSRLFYGKKKLKRLLQG